MSTLSIPEYCGVILLPKTILFPHGALPLHIFEDRYRKMLDDALEGNCLICVGTLLSEETESPLECTSPIGTISLIRASHELEDGRSNLVLHGILRVRFHSWSPKKDYPYARIIPMSPDPFPSGEEPLMISQLRDKVNETLSGYPIDVKEQANEVLEQASSDAATLADAVAQQFVEDTDTRLQILSEPSLDARYELLFRHLAMIINQR